MKIVVALALLLVVGVVSVVRGDDRETFGGFSIVQWSSADSRELVTLAGDSAFTGDSLGLTSDAGEERGALWTGRAYRLNTGFLASFNFYMVPDAGVAPGAVGEGFAFVLQTRTNTITGDPGAGMGYANMNSNNYLAIEFDTFANPGAPSSNPEPNDNHVALVINGVQVAVNDSLTKVLNDGENNPVSVNYTAPVGDETSGRIVATLGSFNDVLFDVNLDLSKELQLIDGESAFLGFTAATPLTGGQTQAHLLRTFELIQYGSIIPDEEFYWFTIAVIAAVIGLFGATACIVMGDSRSSRREKRRRKKKKREKELKKWERDLESREKAGVAAPPQAPPPAYSPGPVLVAGGAQMAANIAMGAPAAQIQAGAPPPQYPPQQQMGMGMMQQPMQPMQMPMQQQMPMQPQQPMSPPQSPTAVPLINGSTGSPQAYLGTDGQGGAVAFQIPELDGAAPSPGKAVTDRALGRANSVGTIQQGGGGRGGPALRRANTDRQMGKRGRRGSRGPRQTAASIPTPSAFGQSNYEEDSIYADEGSAYARPTVNLGSGGGGAFAPPPPAMGGRGSVGGGGGGAALGGRSVKALQGFDGLNPDDLSFPRGAVIIVEQDRGDWLFGKYQGSKGWFPANSVEDV